MRKPLLLVAVIILLLGACLVPPGVIALTLILPSTWASTARLMPQATHPAAIATEIERIQSRIVLDEVITNLNLTRKWGEKFKEEKPLPTELTYQLLRRSVRVLQLRNSLIAITVSGDDKDEAALIANRIAEVYRNTALAETNSTIARVAQIIDLAVPGLRPVRPNKPLNIGLACGFGVILASCGVVLVSISNKQPKRAHKG